MTRPRPQAAIVAIPAHNEAVCVPRCLESVLDAAEHALRHGALDEVHVVLVAHRCDDDTYEQACGVRDERRDMQPTMDVLRLPDVADVGAVRATAVRAGLTKLTSADDRTWIFSTDADSVVTMDWMTGGLSEAAQRSADALVGMVGLDSWSGSDAARQRYDRIVEGGMGVDEDGMPSHRHVYGANLMVRADVYAAVGGFATAGHGEDQRLVDALVDAGHRVVRSRRWVVTTSGRLLGRARGGLADLLHRLDDLPTEQALDAPAAG